MLKNYSYKQKLKWLAISTLPLVLLCYRFSVTRAIGEYDTYKEQKLAQQQNADPASLPMLESKNRMLSKLLDQFVLDTLDDNKNLLNIAGNYCSQASVKLKEYKPLNPSRADSLLLLTRSLTVQGSFKECLELVYELETKFKSGRVSSVLFKSYADPSTAKTLLDCTIYIQNIIPSFYEKK